MTMCRGMLIRTLFTLGVTIALVGDVRVLGKQKGPDVPIPEQQPCDGAAEWTTAHPDRARLFGGVSRENSRTLTWREFPTQADLDKVAGGTVFDFASVWTLPSGALFVQTEATSFSGDWALYVDYCFRPSGTIVRINSDLRVLPEDTMTKETFEFGIDGRQVAARTTYYELKTKTELTGHAADPAREWKARFPTPMHRKMADLPFYNLLKQPRPNRQNGPKTVGQLVPDRPAGIESHSHGSNVGSSWGKPGDNHPGTVWIPGSR